jgi:Tol biopolymer transport system component
VIGQTLSHYRITAALGVGGMGDVYRATDTRLGREVAIKLLPAEVAQDPERLARFEREAHLLASLNHPNIAAIHGLEEADGRPFLALELVEGEDLRTRLARGPLPLDQALEVAEQVAEGLEEAHAKGIVHRDLKPANVKITPEGKVKVLDFGLAKAWAGDAPDGSSGSADVSQSPTLAHSGTVAGVILGTAAYMSPEQARGRPVDRRADVWSFGVLLWEMLTGRALFAGDTVTDIIASVVKEEPDLDALPAATPVAVRRLLGLCLRKDPRTRLPDIGAARLDLQEAIAGKPAEGGAPSLDTEDALRRERSGRRRERGYWVAAALVALGAGALIGSPRSGTPSRPAPATHFTVEVPEGWSLPLLDYGPVPSPDGRRLVFAAEKSERLLWIRALESPTPRSLEGTSGGTLPFWSPDGGSIGFFAEGELRRVDLATGAVKTICTLPTGTATGGSWGEGGLILFAAGGAGARLYTVSPHGGRPELLAPEEASGAWWPQFLPDGRLLYASLDDLRVGSLEEPAGSRAIRPGLAGPWYASGQLLAVSRGTLLAQPFDLEKGELRGEPILLAQSVAMYAARPSLDWGWFAASGGVLAYVEGGSYESELVWLDRQGSRLGTVGKAAAYGQLVLSPDETQVAVELTDPGTATAIWTIDVARGVPTRVSPGAAFAADPVWSPDGSELVYVSGRRVVRKGLLGNEPATPVETLPDGVWPEHWTGDGNTLLYLTLAGPGGQAVWAASLEGASEPELIREVGSQIDEPHPSPDGRWLAYCSQESGQWEVYVEPLGGAGEKVRISPEGGGQPRWRGDGRELFYVDHDGRLMAVEVDPQATRVQVGLPRALFSGVMPSPSTDEYAVTADGQRFLVKVRLPETSTRRFHVVTHWTSLLE